MVRLHREGVVPQAVLEFTVVPRRPHGEDAGGLQRGTDHLEARVVVEAGIRGLRERGGAVVDIEQDGIEAGARGAEEDRDVAERHLGAAILERSSREIGERAAVPLHDRRHELGDHH